MAAYNGHEKRSISRSAPPSRQHIAHIAGRAGAPRALIAMVIAAAKRSISRFFSVTASSNNNRRRSKMALALMLVFLLSAHLCALRSTYRLLSQGGRYKRAAPRATGCDRLNVAGGGGGYSAAIFLAGGRLSPAPCGRRCLFFRALNIIWAGRHHSPAALRATLISPHFFVQLSLSPSLAAIWA